MALQFSGVHLVIVAILCAFVPSLVAISPFRQRNRCGPATCEGGTKFHYKEGNVYLYQYSINGTTSIFRGPTEQSGLHISAQVAIKFISPCEGILFIREVDLWQSYAASTPVRGEAEHKFSRQDTEHHFRSALEEFPLRFSYADGLIEEVCPDTLETPWVLNVKRGLLSSLQNTMRRLDLEHRGQEEDIHGHCNVDYLIGLATASSLTIEKRKDISSCGDKFGVYSSVQGTPYNFGTKYQSMPAVASTSECLQMVDRNLISKVTCSETHRLRTLARGLAGVVNNIQQTLELVSIYDPNYVPKEKMQTKSEGFDLEGSAAPHSSDDDGHGHESGPNNDTDDTETNLPAITTTLPPIFTQLVTNYSPDIVVQRESLHFKHDYNMDPSTTDAANDLQAGRKALEDFCGSVKNDVNSNSGDFFDVVVMKMRGLNYENLKTLSEESIAICEGDRTHFDNALEAVGNAASVAVIKEKILQRGAPPETIRSWIASLTYIQKPGLDLMEAAVDILKERETYPQILLSYSALANTYCRHSPLCAGHRPISILTKLYEKIFTTGCIPSKPNLVEQLIMYLKGIGNFGQFSDGINTALLNCISKSNQGEIKVAAIDAYRRMHCNSDQTVLNKVFQSETEDSEVRIAAFIGLMRCPTYSTIRSIKKTLEREQVNQVGSFVWTYLKNLQKTALPSKAELQGLIADENLSKKFAIDVRKFSRNFEISTFHDDLNFGLGLESNLIFSPKSYLPRSVVLNMTVDLFGESINVFEAGVRLENFEHHIESLFGPKGTFRNRDLHSLISSLRQKRAVPSKRKLRTLTQEYDAHKRYYSDPIASFSLKTFGNEIFYERRAGAQETDFMGLLNPFQHIKQLGDKNINWKKSKLLLESSYIIPTGVGVPLNLSAHASTILRLNTMSLMDIENLRAAAELKMHGKFEPSALLTVKGSMAFGTGAFQTGIQVRAQLHTSTAFEGSFHVKGTKLLKINVGLPKTKQELLEYKSDVLLMQGSKLHLVGQLPKRDPVCTNGFLDKTLGIKLCKSSYFSLSPGSERDNGVSPYFPLNGPAQFAITVEKTNPTLLSTTLNYEWENDEKGTKLTAMYEVEGTETTRLLGFSYLLNQITHDFNFEIAVPQKALQVHGYTKDQKNGGLNITASSEGERTFNALLTYKRDNARPNDDLSQMNMDVDILVTTTSENKLLDAKVKMTPSDTNTGVSMDGTGRLYLANNNVVNLKLNGQLNETRLELGLDSEYRSRSTPAPQTVKWKSVISNWSPSSDAQHIDAHLNLEFSEIPDYNLDTTWKYQRNDDGVDSQLDFRLGKGPAWSDNSALRIKHGLVVQSNYEGSRHEISFWVTQPSRRIHFGFEGSLQKEGRNFDAAINLRATPEKKFQTSLSLKRAPGVLTFVQIGWNTTISNQHPLAISFYLQETANRIYQTEYQNHVTSWELSRKRESKSKKQTLLMSYKNGPKTYFIRTDVDTSSNGLELTLRTDLQLKYPDILLETRIKRDPVSPHSLYVLYKWNVGVDETRKLVLDCILDLTKHNAGRRVELKFDYPGQNVWLTGQFVRNDLEGKNRLLVGQLTWNEDLRLNGNISFNQSPINTETELALSLRRNHLNDASYKLRLSCDNKVDCLLKSDANWGQGQNMNLVLSSEFRLLPREEVEDAEDEAEDYGAGQSKDYDDDGGDDDDDNESDKQNQVGAGKDKSRAKGFALFPTFRPFSLNVQGNLLSTLEDWTKNVKISMRHTHESPLHHKTDIEIQFPNGNDINIASHWLIPVTLKQIWTTRAELHVRTPFQTLQNFQLQVVNGHQEDSDTLATAGIYMDNAQYSITVTGTPRFAEDGSLRMEISTSNPAYDKIFGSLSYAIGDDSRLAFQLGWPNMVISLETGLEWDGSWDEFKVFLTLTSPWKQIKNINALITIDTSQQVELKLEVNDRGFGLKCDWVVESFATFDIRLEGTTPIPSLQKVGFLLKNSFEDDVAYHSQVSLYADEKQVGYKLEGGRSDVEEGPIMANIMNSQIEIDTYFYPTIRSTFDLTQRETKFNLGLSLLLREGPINVSVELHLLDIFSFNEKVIITTPYPSLFGLELNLSPAFYPESDVYNMDTHVKWRSGSEWEKGGVTLRFGDQSAYQSILQGYLENETEDDDYDDENDEYDTEKRKSVEEKPKATVTVAQSQLFHFYSPISWAKVFKIEYEKVKSGDAGSTANEKAEDDDSDGDDEGDDDEDDVQDDQPKSPAANKPAVFPIRIFAFIFSTQNSQITADLQNRPTVKQFSGQIDIREIEQPISLKFDTTLDVSTPERKFNINAMSYHPQLEQFTVGSTWHTRPRYKSAMVEVRTPFENWEVQSISTLYADNKIRKTYNFDLKSQSFGDLGANVVHSPGRFTLVVTTPFESHKELELTGSSNPIDGSPKKVNTIITLKSTNEEILHMDFESTMDHGMPEKLSGTITTKLFKNGNLNANIQRNTSQVNVDGYIAWSDQKLKVTLWVKLPNTNFEELDLRVETPFKNYEKWRVWLQRNDDSDSDEEVNYNETDNDDEDVDDVDDESDEDAFKFIFKIDTPISGFSSITGKGEFPTVVSSYHAVKKVTLSGKAPNGSIDIMTSWIISDWNSFDIHCDSKYSHSITELTFLPSALRSVPRQNSLKFVLRNVVSSLDVISLIDSAFHFETEQPAFRLGSVALIDIQTGKGTSVKLSAKLPHNAHDIDVKSKYDQNLNTLNVDAQYKHGIPSTTWNTRFQMTRVGAVLQGDAEIDLGKGNPLQSKFNYSATGDISQFHLQAFTKNEPNIPIATVEGNFDLRHNRHKARLRAVDTTHTSQPILVDLNAEYKNLLNFDSSINGTTPYDFIPSFGLRGRSTAGVGNEYAGAFGGHLSDDVTLFKYNVAFDKLSDMKRLNGSIAVELPFEELRSGSFGASFNDKQTSFESTLHAELNTIVYLDSFYSHESSSRAGIEKEVDKLELGNPFWPFGISKTYRYEYSGGYGGVNLPTTTTRLLEVYNLVQRDLHKLGGELRIHTNFDGREITLSGIHPNRRLDLSTNYKLLDHQFKHATNFSYSSDSWLGYELSIQNKTTYSKTHHEVDVRVSYPVRVIAINVDCLSEADSLKIATNLNLNASQNAERKLTGTFQWNLEDESYFRRANVHKMSVILKHPSLTKDIRVEGRLQVSEEETLVGDLSLDYSGDPEKAIQVKTRSQLPFQQLRQNNYYFWNLTSDVRLLHPTTDLDLKAFSSTQHSPHELSIITLIDFKNRGKLVRKSKISFELFKQLRQLHIMLSNPDEYLSYRGELSGQYPVYFARAETNITGIHPHIKGHMVVDLTKPYFRAYAVTGRDLTDGLYSEGGIIDSRNVKFQIYESYDNFKFSDVNFLLRMNHSRLVTSKLKWRPELFEELQALYAREVARLKLVWKQQTDKLVRTASNDAAEVIEQIWQDAQTHVGPFLAEMTEDLNFGKDSAALQSFCSNARENNDFYSQDIAGIAQVFADEVSVRYANVYIKIRQYRQELLGDTTTSEMFENTLLWILEKMKDVYRSTTNAWKEIRVEVPIWTPSTPLYFMEDIKAKVAEVFHDSVHAILETGANLSHSIRSAFSSLGHTIGAFAIQVFEQNKQPLFEVFHRVEAVLYAIVVEVSDFVYATQSQVRTSNVYQNMAHLARDIDQLYHDLTRYSTKTNYRKYSAIFKNFVRRKFGDLELYQRQWGDFGKDIAEYWRRFASLPAVESVKDALISVKEQTVWTVQYFKLDQVFQEIAVTLYYRGHDFLYQTAIEANARYQQFKTRFVFDFDKGNVEFEQKLPAPWPAFNDTPDLRELPEYKTFMKLQNLFQSSSGGSPGGSFWDAYYTTEQARINPQQWLPPFDGQAMMIGSNKFYTFDGRFYTFDGPCAYLLTSDLVDGNFSLAVQYKKLRDGTLGHETIVTAGHNTLIFDFEDKTLRDPKKNSSSVPLPVQMLHLQGYQDRSSLVVQHTGNAFTFTCNMQYQICQLKVSGWYSRKLGGLFGTMDEEATTDFMKPNGQITVDPTEMANSWDVSDENVEPCLDPSTSSKSIGKLSGAQTLSNCNKFFVAQDSSLQPCFNTINVNPFLDTCLNETSDSLSKICTSAVAYVSSCREGGMYVQLPSACVRCDVNGEEMMDGDIKMMDSTASSADIVLIIEAKDCNRHVRVKKRMSNLMNALEAELNSEGLRNNRYAVVAFGGPGVYNASHSFAYNNQIFTTAKQLEKFFNNLPASSSPSGGDAFDAIRYGLGLNFRPGVSKTLVLMPCTACNQGVSEVAFSVIQQSLAEHGAVLHMLMSNEFQLENKKLARKIFAMNNEVVYTKLDGQKNVLKGNGRIREQVKINKSFGICTPLALQTNGTIFNGKKLTNKREATVVKWFSSIFTKRLAKSAKAPTCQTCQCTADENGLGKLECYLCGNPRFQYMSENEIDDNSGEKLPAKHSTPDVLIPDLEQDEYTDKDDDDDDDY